MKQITLALALIMVLGAIIYADMPYSNTNPSTDDITWISVPQPPDPPSRANVCKVGDYIYMNGGFGAGMQYFFVAGAAFNIHTQEWTDLKPITPMCANMSMVAVNDSIYYLLPDGNGNMWKFEPTNGGPYGQWSMIGSLPNLAISVTGVWDGGNYILMYVNDNLRNVSECYKLNITNDTLEPMADQPIIRGFPGGAYVDEKFYIFGGHNDDLQMTSSTFEYDPATDTWTQKTNMIRPTAYNLFNTCIIGDLVYLVGGGEPELWPSTDSIQVYDPAIDQWSIYETFRMNDYGTNVACYVPEYDYIFDCGGTDGAVSYYDTWKGYLSGVPELTVNLTPSSVPIYIPANGGTAEFNIAVANNGTSAEELDVWTFVTLPNGTEYGPLINAPGITLGAGSSPDRDRSQNFPASAPSGLYSYRAYIGEYPTTAWDADTMYIVKNASVDGGAVVSDWESWGESFEDEADLSSAATVSEFKLNEAYPNPFNPTANLSFEIRDASNVSLSVFDVNGREVAKLVEGFKPAGIHIVEWNAEGMSSGIYFARLTSGSNIQTQKMVLMK